MHFHDFFRQLHEAVHRHRDTPSAINSAVSQLLADCALLCFDEFHAHDIGDAMLVTRLFRDLFARRTVLVTTSNYPPDGLLPNPIYHHLFLPAIEMIKREMDVVEVAGPTDYRAVAHPTQSEAGFRRGAYLWPGRDDQLAGAGLVRPGTQEKTVVGVAGRDLPALAVRDDHVWFDFVDLCERPTSALDVLALTDRFTVWVVEGLRRLAECSPDARQRFVHLVDVLCDRDVVLFLIGDVPLADVLRGKDLRGDDLRGDKLPADISRTASRLSLLRQIC